MNSYFIFPLPMSYILRSNSEADCAMQETQKPNKEIERLENKGGTLGLLVTTVERNRLAQIKAK
jgi:t-SNARE complex subunit (syntaxin)